ncbi:MAG: OmpA family protein [Rhizobiales bacterium]|nr:OmpA family protein [Hyphomicrobiales bacterium]NRB15553.1 OmpA family protein [Hyphomicrobiales bacterium]
MKKILVLALCTGLVACTSTSGLVNTDELDNAATGAAIGAGVGALGGVLIAKNSNEAVGNAFFGAILGGLFGGGIGLYMDNQEKELRAELDSSGVLVKRVNNQIIITLPSNISFQTGEYSVVSKFYPALNAIAKTLKKYEKTTLEINGHTDSVGIASTNQTLSENRAISVAQYVAARGVADQRIRVRGFGEFQPIADNSSAGGRAANRRVEIAITPH